MTLEAPPFSLLDGGALFLDFDGTLVELAEAPDAIRVSPALPPLLKRLAERLEGRLALISGRAIADLENHIECNGLAVSGSHGLELRLASGDHIPLSAPVDLAGPREEIARFAAEAPGLLVEEKPLSIALHYRRAPEEEGRVLAFMSALAARKGLTVQTGKLVAELRPRGADKGDALRALMMEPPFAGARPIFMGDDITDEDGFEAASRLGGGGILVGAERGTAARWRLEGVKQAAEWLGGAVAA